MRLAMLPVMLTLAIAVRLFLSACAYNGADVPMVEDVRAAFSEKAELTESADAYRAWLETMTAEAYPCD